MKLSKIFYAFLMVFILSAGLAQALPIKTQTLGPYPGKNQAGEKLHRWVVLEPQENQSVLFLVVDEFLNKGQESLPQVIAHREIIPHANSAELHEKIKFYSHFVDGQQFMDASLSARTISERPIPGKPLWVPVKNSWSAQDEADYSAWVSSTVTVDFVYGSSLSVDCADWAMLVRWVYARDHRLPMANSLAGSGQLFGHFSSNAEWDQLPSDPDWRKDQRFQAAMAYLLNSTFTHSLWHDLYPVVINRNYVRPGTIFLFLRPDNGHTQTIKSLDVNYDLCGNSDCFVTYWSTEPASQDAVASIIREPDTFGGMGNVYSGFLGWRWPRVNAHGQWELTPATAMPGYSTMQYYPPGVPSIENPQDPNTPMDQDRENAYFYWLYSLLGMHSYRALL